MTVHVLDAPEASRGERRFLRAFGDGHAAGAGGFGVEVHGGGGEGPHEALDDGRHCGGAEKAEEEEDDLGCGFQFDSRKGWYTWYK